MRILRLSVLAVIGSALILVAVAAASSYRAVRFRNAYRRAIIAEIRDGEATATGSSCDTNDSIETHRFESGEMRTYPCGGRDGFCFRWKNDGESEFGGWYGASCGGHSAASRSDIKDVEF